MKKFLAAEVGFLVAVVFALVMVLQVTQVHAQTPTTCPSGVTSATVKSNTTFTLLWCSPLTDAVTGANAYGLGQTPVALQSVQQIAGPYSDGLVQMRGIVPGQPKGKYTFTLRATNTGGEGAASAPFDLGVVDPIPTAPINLRVQ